MKECDGFTAGKRRTFIVFEQKSGGLIMARRKIYRAKMSQVRSMYLFAPK
jgi:hypothetical protein